MRGGRAEADDQGGREGLGFGDEPWAAGGDFARVRFFVEAAFAGGFPLEMFDGVGDVSEQAIDSGFGEGAIEEFASGADEGLTGEVLFVAGLFADEEDAGALGAFAEDGLRAGLPERAGPASFGGGAEFAEVPRRRRLREHDIPFHSRNLAETNLARHRWSERENARVDELLRAPSVDPTSVYRYRDGLYAADLLTAALVHLDFFTWLGRAGRGLPFEEVCMGLALKERPADVMLTLFTAMGLLERREGNFFVTTLAREQLMADSPWFLGPYYASLKDRPVTKDFVSVLKTGRTANWGSFKETKDWAKAMEDETFANGFTAAMDCRGVYLAQAAAKVLPLGDRKRLLDIGGGSGVYACSFAAHFSNLRATVFEKPPVDKVAARAITKRNMTGRVEVVAGDVFKDALPTGYDVHLISNVLHDWDWTEVRAILGASVKALEPGGLLVIHDAWINADKTGPLPVAAYSAMLMHSTEGKCYSTLEIETILRELGMGEFMFRETAADRGVLTARKV